MAKSTFTRNSYGAHQVLNSPEVAELVRVKANEVAGRLLSAHLSDAYVVVDSYETDRAAASVTIRHKDAKGWQARDGLFTRAAAAVGLQMRARK